MKLDLNLPLSRIAGEGGERSKAGEGAPCEMIPHVPSPEGLGPSLSGSAGEGLVNLT